MEIVNVGDKIGSWEVQKVFRGGMGVVYIVFDNKKNELFAAKTFYSAGGNPPGLAERFKQEAASWITLDIHPNIAEARSFEYISTKNRDNIPFLCLEYVSGGDLSKRIGTMELLRSPSRVLDLSLQFCDGMQHAVNRGIIAHRDIKPSNCLVTENGILKITDFGLAKVVSEERNYSGSTSAFSTDFSSQSRALTQTGIAAGTPTHMAPEQFLDAKRVDIRADIYSFGVLLFQMISGKLPFEGRNFPEFAWLHQSRSPQVNMIADVRLRQVLTICLEKEPGNRFQSFYELREHLGRIYEVITNEPTPQAVTGVVLSADRLVNSGLGFLALERKVRAISYFDRAIAIDPLCGAAWERKAMVAAGESNFESATIFFQQLLKCPLAAAERRRMALGWSLKHHPSGFYGIKIDEPKEKDLFYLNGSLALNPNDLTTVAMKASLLKRLNRQFEAKEALTALKELPRNSAAKASLWFVIDPALGRSLRLLSQWGRYNLLIESDIGAALDIGRHFRPDFILFQVNVTNYAEITQLASQVDMDPILKSVPRVFLSPLVSKEEAKVKREGLWAFLAFPLIAGELLACVEMNIRRGSSPSSPTL